MTMPVIFNTRRYSYLKINTIVGGLPIRTFHVLELLHVGVSSALKEDFRRLIKRRNIFHTNDVPNDTFTLCELVCQTYQKYVGESNIVGGFHGNGP